MIRSIKTATLALLLAGVCQGVRAEDDLMSILEGKNAPAATQFVESAEIAKLKQVMKPSSAEQNIFFQFLAEKNYEKSLFQWNVAYGGSAFAGTQTGQALESFLNYKNGLKFTAIEKLFAIKDPQQIDNSVVSLWKENLGAKETVWGLAQVTWNPFWTSVFGTEAENAVLLQKTYVTEDLSILTDLIKKTPVDSPQRNILQWQLVLNLGVRGDSGKAAQVLALLMKAKNNPIDVDLMTITAARLLYQNGFLDAAIKYDEKISKKSDYWFEAQEEKAWAFMRKGEPQNALAVTQTLRYPYFKGWVGIETYLLDSFSHLKVCDYSGVLATMKDLKGQFGDHLSSLEKLSVDPQQPAVKNLLKMLTDGPVETAKLGADAHVLPSHISRDEVLTVFVKRQQSLNQEAELAAQLYARSLTFGNLQGSFEALKNQVQGRAQLNESASYQRVQELAKAELADSKQVLQRLRIVEVEMIQQVEASSHFVKSTAKPEVKAGTTGSGTSFAMTYVKDKEVWFDELSNYKVDVKRSCSKESTKE